MFQTRGTQEDGCINMHVTVCFTRIGISSLVGRMGVFDTHNRLPEDELFGSTHVEDIKNSKLKY
jgi:hypothetical protein